MQNFPLLKKLSKKQQISLSIFASLTIVYFLSIKYIEVLVGSYYERELYDRGGAFFWYKRAADRGYPPAQFKAGMMYIEGFGIRYDIQKGLQLIRESAEKGFGEAQYELAKFYYKKRDKINSFKWYKAAAESGYKYSYLHLARHYHYGEGVTKNIPTAIKWYKKGAEENVTLNAQYEYGVFLAEGKWVKQDLQKANQFIQKAIDQNYPVYSSDIKKLNSLGLNLKTRR